MSPNLLLIFLQALRVNFKEYVSKSSGFRRSAQESKICNAFTPDIKLAVLNIENKHQ